MCAGRSSERALQGEAGEPFVFPQHVDAARAGIIRLGGEQAHEVRALNGRSRPAPDEKRLPGLEVHPHLNRHRGVMLDPESPEFASILLPPALDGRRAEPGGA